MNRRTRTLLPTTSTLLESRRLDLTHVREKQKDVQKRQARYYNSNAQDLPPLSEGDTVRMKKFVLGQKDWKKGVVVERLDVRSYEVETADRSFYRPNKAHLKRTNELPVQGTTNASPQVSNNPDVTGDSTCQEGPRNTLDAPNVELGRETAEPDFGAATMTRSGQVVKRPSYLRDYIT